MTLLKYIIGLVLSVGLVSASGLAADDSVVGVGVAIKLEKGLLIVIDTVPNSPAEADGRIQLGDKIRMIKPIPSGEWQSTDGMSLGEAVGLIRGPEGEEVGLWLSREDSEDIDIRLKRRAL